MNLDHEGSGVRESDGINPTSDLEKHGEASIDVTMSASTQSLLIGLSHSHPFVIAIDSQRRIVWMSDELDLIYPGADKCVGQSVEALVAEVAVNDNAEFLSRANDFVTELHATGRVKSARFDLGQHPTAAPVETTAFRFQTDTGEMLSVCMSRRLAPDAPISPEPAPLDPNSRLAFILDATPDAVLSIDQLGFVTSANAAAGRILGHAATELIDQPLTHFIKESGRVKRIAEMMFGAGSVESEEFEMTRDDGRRIWLSISARRQPFPRTDGTMTNETIVLIRDVTSRHLAAEALERKNAELENCVRNVSHDLRSPLTSLLGFTRLLRDDHAETLAGSGHQFLDRIEESARNIEALLHGMLELSRIGVAPLRRRVLNPRLLLMQIESEQKLPLDAKGIALEIPESPPAVFADETQLYQLFSNLIGNAISHRDPTAEGESAGKIVVDIHEVEDGAMISVADDGPGIAIEDQDRVFEMFQTAGTNRAGHKSSGLGLAIVKKIVDAHGGQVWIDSQTGRGARFVVHLPSGDGTATPSE